MDRDSILIMKVLNASEDALTTAQISKEIYDQYKIRLSKKVVKNYLWSYFRNEINFKPDDCTYKLKSDMFLLDKVDIELLEKPPRAFTCKITGGRIVASVDSKVSVEVLAKAVVILNLKKIKVNDNVDFIKAINRSIENLTNADD
jgi:hypothetical protein